VLSLDEVLDALVVDVDGRVELFVVLAAGRQADEALARRLAARIREQCSPRHVPNAIYKIDEVPRTLSGKMLEVPVKKILTGTPPEQAVSHDALRDPDSLQPFLRIARGSDT
jgi:acetoacetyl-CoA synthetase